MLFGRRNITGGTIGKSHIKRGLEGALRFQLQAGNAVDFIGKGGDGEVAKAQGLEDKFFRWVVANPERF